MQSFKNKSPLLVIITAMIFITSCTKSFKEYNTDPTGVSNNQLQVDYQNLGAPLIKAQQNIYVGDPAWAYQLQQNLIADVYSGYMMSPDPFQNGQNNTNYALVDGWNGYPWDWTYNNVMNNIRTVLTATSDPKYASFYQWAKILRVEAMHRISDIYGPIVYTHYGTINADGSVSYDSQKDAYSAFFNDLDSAINVFTDLSQKNEVQTFTKFDLAYGGDYTKWTKFANTLRLRLALRIVKADPVKAQAEGEKSLSNPIGLMATNDDNLFISIGDKTHPLDVIDNSWDDIRLGAPVATYLNGYADPRIAKYALKATDAAVAGQYIGIRNGTDVAPYGRYTGYSKMAVFSSPGNTKVQLMVAAEAWFLKAEAAIRGWNNAGDAQTNYETGIQTSFSQYGLDAASYINDATSTPAQYIDPNSVIPGANNITTGSPYLSTITIKWEPAATFDKMLERIITQKWIAMYPEGQEAWSEFRRTGYPKLFPVVINNSNGVISTTDFIRRIPFAASDRSTNPIGVAAATALLNGPDNGATHLWWDTP